MDKEFFDVFPGLHVNQDLINLFGQTTANSVVVNKHEKLLTVNITSKRLIHYNYVALMEQEMEKQMFTELGLSVKICERYALSQQYTVESLFDIYFDRKCY